MAPLIDMIIVWTGPVLVIFLTFYLLYFGKKSNTKIMNNTRDTIGEVWDRAVSTFVERDSSATGILWEGQLRGGTPLKSLRIFLALEERHLLLSTILYKFGGGPTDYIAFEGDPKARIPCVLQIIPRKEEGQIKKHKDLLLELDDAPLGVTRFDEYFMMKSSSRRVSGAIMADRELVKKLYEVRNNLVRISVNRKDTPSLKLFAFLNDSLNYEKFRDLLFHIAENIQRISKKDHLVSRKKTR